MAQETQLRLSCLASHQQALTSGQSAHDKWLDAPHVFCYCLLMMPRQTGIVHARMGKLIALCAPGACTYLRQTARSGLISHGRRFSCSKTSSQSRPATNRCATLPYILLAQTVRSNLPLEAK